MSSRYEPILREVNHAVTAEFQAAGFAPGEIRFGSRLTTALRFRREDLGFVAMISYDGIEAFDAIWVLLDDRTLAEDHYMWATAPAAVDAFRVSKELFDWKGEPFRCRLVTGADEIAFTQNVIEYFVEAVIPLLSRTDEVRRMVVSKGRYPW